jgi:hypothetical protein
MKKPYIQKMGLALASFAIGLLCLSSAGAVEIKLGGQVNQMVMWADDGSEDNFYITDNDNSSTRFNFVGEEDFGPVRAGLRIEFEAQRNASNKLYMEQEDDGDFEFNDRWFNVYFNTAFGKIELGKGDGAANGTAEVDLSGTSVINYSEINATAGGFIWKNSDGTAFRDNGTAGSPDYLTVGDTRSNLDGLSRNERLRYNTPVFGGFTAATSFTNGKAWELAGRYDGEFAGQKLGVAIGYVDGADRSDYTQLSGSVSWLAPFGLNLTGAYGLRDFEDDDVEDATNMYAKVGYKWSIHAVSAEYGVTADLSQEDDESSNWGLAYVVTPWSAVEFYGSYRIYMLEVDGVDNPDDINQFMAGTRIKF